MNSEREDFTRVSHLVYAFHMPCFIIISGMLTKIAPEPLYSDKILRKFGAPFIVFSILYETFFFFYFGEASTYLRQASPHWILWFAYNLIVWRMILPPVARLRWPRWLILTAAAVFAIAVSCLKYNGYIFGLSRLVTLFPFFLAGYFYRAEILRLCEGINNFLALAFFVILMAGYFSVSSFIEAEMLLGSHSFADMGYEAWHAIGIRIFLYGFSTIASLCFLGSMPRKRLFPEQDSDLLYIYLTHGFALYVFYDSALFQWIESKPPETSLPIFLLLSLALTIILGYSTQAARQLYRMAISRT